MTQPPLSRRLRSTLFLALRAAFRAVPMSEAQRDQLRSRFLRRFPGVRPLPAQGQVVGATERRPRVRADERCIGYVEYSEEPLPDPLPATLVAFYLPQFHTIPENDEWWGKGFTEWRNVTRALPQFEGHLQPRLPGDLGFYDLRNPQVMRDQAKLAKTYGLSAFCFYFYWFGGKTLLEEPLRNWLKDKSIDFQYCLCWANENWTRRWDGRDDEVLIAQKHSPEDDIAFIQHVAEYLRDPRYLRVDGKPILLLYRPMLLPDAKATAERWRSWCRENGIGEIHLAYVQSFERPDPRDIGFDAAVEFPPNLADQVDIGSRQTLFNPAFAGEVLDWRAVAAHFRAKIPRPHGMHLGVNCGWDNEPRRPGHGRAFLHATPTRYREWLRESICAESHTQPVTFINAWNEWAEGAVLEPDASRGYAWLQATRDALRDAADLRGNVPHAPTRPCVVIHAWYPDIFKELLQSIKLELPASRIVVTTPSDNESKVRQIAEQLNLTIEIVITENRGRDILPFLRAASQLRQEGESIVLKLHTKASPHRQDGAQWRQDIVDALLAKNRGQQLFQLMAKDSTIGVIAPSGHVVSIGHYWGANRAHVHRLCANLGIAPPNEQDGTFIAGSMFWVNLACLADLLEAAVSTQAFDPEHGQLDGTFAHAVERIFGACAWNAGYRVLTSDLKEAKGIAATYSYGDAL